MTRFIASTLVACLMAGATVLAAPSANRLGIASGIYIQEYWQDQAPRYFAGNSGGSPVTIQLSSGPKLGAGHPHGASGAQLGSVTVPAGGALDLDGSAFLGANHVEIRALDGSEIGNTPGPVIPPRSMAVSPDYRLTSGLNGVQAPNSSLWFSIASIPRVTDTSGTITFHCNHTVPGWLAVRNTAVTGFPLVQITSVTSTTQPIRQNAGAWFVDLRSSRSLMQTVVVKYAIPKLSAPSLALFDFSLVDAHRVMLPLPRAILLGAPSLVVHRHTLISPRTVNRPLGGR